MDNWDEVRTAYHVARLGTVSGAAEALGVHHATVIRHVDALEDRLGVKLFQRHARGYAPTEAGQDLMRVASATDDQFLQLAGRLKGQGDTVSGELIVTSLLSMAPMMVPAIASFREAHPQVIVRYVTDERLFRLEYGEAHVAVRAGMQAPDEPDNVVQPFGPQRCALFASQEYLDRHGMPAPETLAQHMFVGHDNPENRAPFQRWLRDTVPGDQIVFRSGDSHVLELAIRSGMGLGCLPVFGKDDWPDLVQVIPPKEEWSAPLWLVTHVDLHRSAKVQSFVQHLKAVAKQADAIWR